MKVSLSRFTLGLMAMLACLPAAANHIDFIQDDSDPSNGVTNATFSLSNSSSTPVMDTQIGEPADILGGQRTVTVVQDGDFPGTITAEKLEGTDFISVMNSTTAAGTVTLDYSGFENADFATRWSRIDVSLSNIDIGAIGNAQLDVLLSVESSAGTGTAVSGRITELNTGGSTVVSFPFTDPGFAAVDFRDVDRLTAVFDTAIIGTDFRIDSITREGPALVPEPATTALAGLALLGGVVARRRRG